MVQQNINMSEKKQKTIVIIPFIVLIVLVTLFSSCGTTKQGGGCGGNPFNEGY